MASSNPFGLSRRGFCLCCVGATAAAGIGWLSPQQAFAEARNVVDGFRADAARAPINVHPLRGNVSVLEGSGGNIAVLTGNDGKLLVDAGLTASKPRITEALSALDPRPVTHLINTHWHFDHADGNEWIGGKGVAIVAHDNTRKHLTETQRVEDWDFNFPPLHAAAIPTQTFADQTSLDLNAVSLDLKHRPGAHTDGDITVHFTEANILHSGDVYWNGVYPFIDYSTGGSIDGVIRAADAILAQIDDDTIVIPGHGRPNSNRSELAAYRGMLAANRDSIATLKQQGRTLVQIVAARPTAAFDAAWGKFAVTPALFTKLVYEGV